MMFDVIVVGGSFAGLSAALQLVRARRRVLVIDTRSPRNRFAAAAHGVLGHDGKTPAAILAVARNQIGAYPTASFLDAEIVQAIAEGRTLSVMTADKRTFRARRLLLATGVSDRLPDIPGLSDRWGTSVLHCPYCHGYEVRDQLLGVLANHPMAAHQAALLPDWGPATLFTQGQFEPDAEQIDLLTARGVAIERAPVVGVLGRAPALDAVKLSDGRVVPINALFVAPTTTMASPLAEQLGCAFDDGFTGRMIRVDDWKATSVPGVYAAGDAARAMHSVSLALADGAIAGIGAHQSLVREVSP
jgi:thioredoxin reductase